MRFRDLWRTTTFRLTVLYGALFAVGTIALLGLVYLRSAVYLTSRVDGILNTEADALVHSPRPGLRQRVIEELALNGNRNNVFGLFSADGTRVAGNIDAIPASLHTNGQPIEYPATAQFPTSARLIARRLSTGETLVIGRDISQLQEMRGIITSALIWSGVAILLIGLACGTALSLGPIKRLRRLQAVAHDIARGQLERRMPTSGRHDELDMFAATVNHMIGEVQRLMSEVKGTTAVIAHDLLSPLAHATLQLRRLQAAENPEQEGIARVATRIDEVLERFRAILRIAELEARQRRAGFANVDLAEVVAPAADLYGPLAEAAGVRLITRAEPGSRVEADPKLLFEALSNLIDNAIKFAGRGSTVQVRVGKDPTRPRLLVEDDGPGIAINERAAVLQRFYRGERNRPIAGSGLGLSVVTAIMRLHDFELVLEDADPGLRAVIECRPRVVSY
ncbi:MAG TPA: HAMP domain-containing sensor histidine kinase [Steroidobacteraceae bacterium]|nr:HAMP domain-containing sensor histidine kinase [Steroidobacteraceae bacterium]